MTCDVMASGGAWCPSCILRSDVWQSENIMNFECVASGRFSKHWYIAAISAVVVLEVLGRAKIDRLESIR